MSQNQRKELVYSKTLSIGAYSLQLYIVQPEGVKDKLTALYMRGNKAIYRVNIPYNMKNAWIFKQIRVKSP